MGRKDLASTPKFYILNLMYEQIIRHTMGLLWGLAFLLTFGGGWWAKERGWWWMAILIFLAADLAFIKIIKSLK